MRRLWMGVALTLMVTHAAFAAVQYEFIQTSRSDSDGLPPTDLSARALIDGSRTRVDFVSGNAYPPGTYVLSTDNARKLQFVDPTQRSYTEVNTLTIASAIRSSAITIEKLVPTVTKFDDKKIIAGIPADHYRLTITFDITVNFRSIPLKQTVRTEIDKWTTVRFGEVSDGFAQRTLQTGNIAIDDLILAETQKISGFTLQQSMKITAVNSVSKKARADSKLNLPTTRTLTREMTVTSIGEVQADEALFRIPTDFKRSDFNEIANKTQAQVLSVEPPSK